MQTMIVFSHLRWDFVYQRPQHLLSRFAEHYRVIFFEEPEYHDSEVDIVTTSPLRNLTVCRCRTPVSTLGFAEDQMPYLRRLLGTLVDEEETPLVWFYTPMALPLLEELNPKLVIYDCMDELSAFKNPPPRLLEYEDQLLKRADVVFTGGPSLQASKVNRNPNVHCFPSSVDVNHFRQAQNRNIAHASMQGLPRPRLGFYGVIDERFDAELLAAMADAHPEWQLVMVGPVVKIDPATLPRRPNISYMGQQPYSALPQFLAGWDVCLMPFALNESTRFISPTKSLEYMAAELPIVSTPIKDVVDLHSDVVAIASNAQEFIAACEAALNTEREQALRRVRLMRDKLSRTSWSATALRMRELIQQCEEDAELQTQDWAMQAMPAAGGRLAGLTD